MVETTTQPWVTRQEHTELEQRARHTEGILDGLVELLKQKATISSPPAKPKSVAACTTKNQAGFCKGDVVQVTWDKEFWTRKRSKLEGATVVVCDVTPCFVRCQVKGDPSVTKTKKNHNVKLLQAAHATVQCKDEGGKWVHRHSKAQSTKALESMSNHMLKQHCEQKKRR